MIDPDKTYVIQEDISKRYLTGLMGGVGETVGGRKVRIPSFGAEEMEKATRVDGDVVNELLNSFPMTVLATPLELTDEQLEANIAADHS
jgi:hypothetical protein